MSLNPLTPAGVQTRLGELYGLSDPALAIEAAAIQADFRSWVEANFDLSSAQEIYLTGMATSAVNYYGYLCSICFVHRLSITLDTSAPPILGYSKWVEAINSLVFATDNSEVTEVTGSVTFVVDYRLSD